MLVVELILTFIGTNDFYIIYVHYIYLHYFYIIYVV